MKKLQNNFTTPEQSKRLLELGVPADSADCYHDMSLNRRGVLAINGVYSKDVPYNHLFSDGKHRFLPCWSVGRLIEIFEVCTGIVWENAIIDGYTKIDLLIEDFDGRHVSIDFSKLEE